MEGSELTKPTTATLVVPRIGLGPSATRYTGGNPSPLSGKHASTYENPESPRMTWATKLGANSTPTTTIPTPFRAVIPKTLHTVARDTSAP